MSTSLTFLCLASYFKGDRFLRRLHNEGCQVLLLTIESLLTEAWPREALSDVFAVKNFHDRRGLVNAVAYLMRTRKINHVVALDDFDVEVAAHLREHFRLTDTGHGDSKARHFRDKLAMRYKAKEIGIRIPDFCPLFHHEDVSQFLARVPGPWLIKPRSEASAAGIRKLYSVDEVWKRIHELNDDQSNYLLEQMIPGNLFHVDSLTYNNDVIFSEVNAYARPLLDVYQGGGIYATRTFPRNRPEVQQLKNLNSQLLRGFELGQGASHTEFMQSHEDGEFYFIETSARVGGANIADMVEHATGVNLWSEWAKLEICRHGVPYTLPELRNKYGGVIISLSRQERPDTSTFHDSEIVHRLDMKNHIGFVLSSDTPDRIEELLRSYMERIAQDFHASLPGADKVSH